MQSKKKRSMIKALTWRTVATLMRIGIIFETTGDLSMSSAAGGAITVVNGVGQD